MQLFTRFSVDQGGVLLRKKTEGSMAWALLSRLAASSVAKLPVKMWVVMDFEICFRVTALDLILKISESLASLRA